MGGYGWVFGVWIGGIHIGGQHLSMHETCPCICTALHLLPQSKMTWHDGYDGVFASETKKRRVISAGFIVIDTGGNTLGNTVVDSV